MTEVVSEPTYFDSGKFLHRSDAVVFNGVVYVSGIKSPNKQISVSGQTVDILAEIDRRLAEVGTDKSRLLSATIWMHDVVRDVAELNAVWNEWLTPGRRPARSCVQATLQGGSAVEIAVITAV
ncbi:RidA family protein [Mesorhizobium sp. VK23B]|uniref:RidA family protein n=1 Tax=Mesorhizobium dulcispinae TaxID=3072316 RepID=A0ABU4XPQ1_9HYPH|nr:MULTISPECIES: RidA family protein [unclassified Mesorhizobium]MDX8470171.1 RidA family protein [Mesorhizobium sp. VK23B]MDX8476553.1 RidA family protein [Mesorhizobium sp. VK23A]